MRTAFSVGSLPKVLAGQDDLWRKRGRAPMHSVSFRRTVSRGWGRSGNISNAIIIG
jgi:hypothetical protein